MTFPEQETAPNTASNKYLLRAGFLFLCGGNSIPNTSMPVEAENSADTESLFDTEGSLEGVLSPEVDEGESEANERKLEPSDSENPGGPDTQEFVEPGKQAVMEQKNGEENDWELHSRGESGYRFDGKEILDAEGNSWTKKIESGQSPEEIFLHHEMLAQWRDGGDPVFFLPDHVESLDGREILYVTILMLGRDGSVSYEIWAHEITYDTRGEDENGEELTDTHKALSLETTGEFSEAAMIDRSADTLMSVVTAEGSAVDDSEPAANSGERAAEESVSAITTEERVAAAPGNSRAEAPTILENHGNTKSESSPGSWLAEFLNIGPFESLSLHDSSPQESGVSQESAREGMIMENSTAPMRSEFETEAEFGAESPVIIVPETGNIQTTQTSEHFNGERPLAAIEILDQKALDGQTDIREISHDPILTDASAPIKDFFGEPSADKHISTVAAEAVLEAPFGGSQTETAERSGRGDSDEVSVSPKERLTEAFGADTAELSYSQGNVQTEARGEPRPENAPYVSVPFKIEDANPSSSVSHFPESDSMRDVEAAIKEEHTADGQPNARETLEEVLIQEKTVNKNETHEAGKIMPNIPREAESANDSSAVQQSAEILMTYNDTVASAEAAPRSAEGVRHEEAEQESLSGEFLYRTIPENMKQSLGAAELMLRTLGIPVSAPRAAITRNEPSSEGAHRGLSALPAHASAGKGKPPSSSGVVKKLNGISMWRAAGSRLHNAQL